MELKLTELILEKFTGDTFNRTSMELKHTREELERRFYDFSQMWIIVVVPSRAQPNPESKGVIEMQIRPFYAVGSLVMVIVLCGIAWNTLCPKTPPPS